MSFDAVSLNAFALETCVPPPGARTVGQTLTVRLRAARSDGAEPMEGTLEVGSPRTVALDMSRAAVVAADAKPLTITL